MSAWADDNGRLFKTASIARSYGRDGKVLLKTSGNFSEDYDISEPVFLYFEGLPVPFFITAIEKKDYRSYIIKFDGTDDLSHAEELSGRDVYAETSGRDGNMEDPYFCELCGYTLLDQHGSEIGTIINFLDYPGNPCLEVRDASGKKIIVPANDDLIINIDALKKILTLEMAEGLADI
ncbi:MAG: ribosome maturation factor RimM [Bacteroidales bacterium]|jgi:16S rRNA processing protein RimM|nr:ribosome maturation factor RimM [Bacteroidales bacterium]